MTYKDKELLLILKDLCARLPYEVKVKCPSDDEIYTLLSINWNKETVVIGFMMDDMYVTSKQKLVDIKPYLRPMSSMTEVEKHIYDTITKCHTVHQQLALFEWLLKKHFDFMGLIPKGLAIEVTEENNPYKD